MSGTPDARLIATEYRQRIAQCILDGVNRYKEAVANQAQKPSGGGVAATDPTSVPNLDRAVGAQTEMESSVAQAQDALQSSPAATKIDPLDRSAG